MRRALSILVLAAALMSCRGTGTTAPPLCPSADPAAASNLGTEPDASEDAGWFRAVMAGDPRLSAIDVDARLSTVTAALAEDPDASLLQIERWSTTVGTPLSVLDAVWLERDQPDLKMFAGVIEELPGTAPVVAGVSSSCSRPGMVAVLLARQAVALPQAVPRDATAFAFEPTVELQARFAALVLTKAGVEEIEATPEGDRFVVQREAGFANAAVELVTVQRSGPFGHNRQTVGLLRFSRSPGPSIATPSSLEEGINAVRAAWQLSPIAFVDRGPVDCDHEPIEIGTTAVTLRQLCADAPVVGTQAERWELLARRPIVLHAVADPRLTVGQIDAGGAGRLRLAERFEDLTADQFEDALTAELAQRWAPAAVRASLEDKARDLLQRWADEQNLNTPQWAMQEAARLQGAYSGEERSRYVLSVAQTVRDTLPYASDLDVTQFQVSVHRGQGPSGEPLFWTLILTAAPER